MEKKRIAWIDAAKGIAMILVVLGHNQLQPLEIKILYCLNVPIFFVMSGYTFRTEKYDSVLSLIKVLLKRVLLPYAIMNLLGFFVWHWARDLAIDWKSIFLLFFGTFYGVSYPFLRFNVPLWFLPCIAVVQLLWYVIDRYGKKAKAPIVFVLSVIGYLLGGFGFVRLPWGADVALTGLAFFALGNLLRKTQAEKVLFHVPSVLGFALMLICNLGLNFLNRSAVPNVDVNAMVFGNYFLFYLSALSGVLAVIYLAKLLENRNLLGYVGKNTLWILGLHSLFIQLFELKLHLHIVPYELVNSAILCVLEIACVCILRFSYEQLLRKIRKE